MGSAGRQLLQQRPLLSQALDRFHSELKSDNEGILGVDNVEELLAQAKVMEPALSSRTGPSSFKRLESILPHLNDFAAIIAVCSGADAKATGLVWGSLKVIFMLASPSSDTLGAIVNMLDELSLSLPRFRSYEENLPMDDALESSLIEVYAEMTCFCARTINFFRSNPHRALIKLSWPKFNNDFNQTIKRLKKLSRIVDTKAEEVRLREDRERNTELLSAMELMKNTNIEDDVLPCYLIPFGVDEQFHGRLDVLERLEKGLLHEIGALKVNVLCGMGGVGKTKCALQYVNKVRQDFDAIFWISADNSIKLTQDFLQISKKLHLSPNVEDAQDAIAAMSKVKTWLSTTNCRWLLVFDNADDPDILLNAWPGAATGSILITSRDSTAAFGTSAETIHVLPFDEDTSVEAFISFVGRDPSSNSDRHAAREISRALGGLPLAINQISGFIVQQKLALKDFLPLYLKNAAKIDARKLKRGDYGHTLSTVWELSLAQLLGISSTLQKLLAFFDPDKIHECVLLEGSEHIEDEEFVFLRDDMDFLDAKEPLLKAALIDRSSETQSLTIHRLVQTAVMRRLTKDEKICYFDAAITILSNGFPNTWNTVTSHQFTSWAKCELCLPHVNFLIEESKKYSLKASDPKKFSELILRCCWYLYEREHYSEARQFMKTALENLEVKDSLMYASATMLDGLIELDTNNISKALDSFLLAFKIRQPLMNPDDAFIASSLNALSIAYTELGDFDKAIETGQRAIDIRRRTKSDRIGNSYSNMASTLMRMGKADEAEEMLKRCPSLKEFTDETFLQTGNPRFSGDMVLLARIRLQQGRLGDAIRLSSKALTFRQKLLGSRLKVCDSLYQVASLLEIRGDRSSSINLLEESVSIAENIPEAKGYEARAQYRLSRLYKALGNGEKSQQYEIAAKKARGEISHDSPETELTEKDYDSLVLWMLW